MHWFFDPAFSEKARSIANSEVTHFKSLRIRSGEQVTVTNGIGDGFVCKVIDPTSGAIEVLSRFQQRQNPLNVHLVQALAKGDRDEQAVQACVELGVTSITPWQSELAVSNWEGKESKGRARWQEIAISAMKQSQQAFLPHVNEVQVTSELRPIGLGVVLDPRANKVITDMPHDVREVTIVVGPEGGLTNAELNALQQHGFETFRLGQSVLRTSTAGPAALASILTTLRSW